MICVRSAEAAPLKLLFFSPHSSFFFFGYYPLSLSLKSLPFLPRSWSLCLGRCPIMPIRSTTTAAAIASQEESVDQFLYVSAWAVVCAACHCWGYCCCCTIATCPLLLLLLQQLLSLIVVAIECSLSFFFTFSLSLSPLFWHTPACRCMKFDLFAHSIG